MYWSILEKKKTSVFHMAWLEYGTCLLYTGFSLGVKKDFKAFIRDNWNTA